MVLIWFSLGWSGLVLVFVFVGQHWSDYTWCSLCIINISRYLKMCYYLTYTDTSYSLKRKVVLQQFLVEMLTLHLKILFDALQKSPQCWMMALKRLQTIMFLQCTLPLLQSDSMFQWERWLTRNFHHVRGRRLPLIQVCSNEAHCRPTTGHRPVIICRVMKCPSV